MAYYRAFFGSVGGPFVYSASGALTTSGALNRQVGFNRTYVGEI